MFLAYEYGCAVGIPASEAMKLPIRELEGYIAYKRLRNKTMDNN